MPQIAVCAFDDAEGFDISHTPGRINAVREVVKRHFSDRGITARSR
jgi:hypothetical protein